MGPVLPPTADNLDRAAAVLRAGGLVGLPTETVYGLAGDGLDAAAIARIYAAKERPRFNPLILHVAPVSLEDLVAGGLVDAARLSTAARASARALVALWPGPLTIVLPRGPAVPDLTAAGLDTIALRAPDHPVAQALIARSGPVAAPSANRSGRISPTCAADVAAELGDAVDCILDGGPCTVGLESTVVHITDDGHGVVLRPGTWDADHLTGVTGVPIHPGTDRPDAPRSPGTTSRHYAPRTPFFALPARAVDLDLTTWIGPHPTGLLCWTEAHAAETRARYPGLSASALDPDGHPARTAQRLYAGLRALDARGFDTLLCDPFPPPELGDTGLLHALRDRMRRATVPFPG